MNERDKSLNGRPGPNLYRSGGIWSSPLPVNGGEQHRIVDCVYCAARVSRSVADRRDNQEKERKRFFGRLEFIEVAVVVLSLAGVFAGLLTMGGLGA